MLVSKTFLAPEVNLMIFLTFFAGFFNDIYIYPLYFFSK
jgi:hypothetical protein